MKMTRIVLVLVLLLPFAAQAEVERDCVLEGTVKKSSGDSDKVYVAFHSAKPAEKGANCRIKRNEKLHFKQPTSTGINDARPGSRVEYRYTQDSEQGDTWELRQVHGT